MSLKMFTYKTGIAAFCLTASIGFGVSSPIFAQEEDMEESMTIEDVVEEPASEDVVVEEAPEEIMGEDSLSSPGQEPDVTDADVEIESEVEVESEVEAEGTVTEPETGAQYAPTEDSDIAAPTDLDLDSLQLEAEENTLYQNLEAYLNEEEWEAADRETFDVLLTLVGPESKEQGYFSSDEWDTFIADTTETCPKVQRIDDLWRQASNDMLGFGIQKQLFDDVGRVPSSFYSRIGWINPTATEAQVDWELNSDASAEDAVTYVKSPRFTEALSIPGHLPAIMYWEGGQDRRLQLFFSCGLSISES